MKLLDIVIEQLTLLSKVNAGEKLYTSESIIESVDKNMGVISGCIRKVSSDSKIRTAHVVENVYEMSEEIYELITNSRFMNSDLIDRDLLDKKKQYCDWLDDLYKALQSGVRGINNLNITYKEDTAISSKLQMINDKMQRLIKKIHDKSIH